MSKTEWELFKEAADKPANNPRQHIRTLGFSIHETFRDMWILGVHYIRPSDDAEFEECFDCKGWGCFSGDRYGDRYKHCTEDQCFCARIDPSLKA